LIKKERGRFFKKSLSMPFMSRGYFFKGGSDVPQDSLFSKRKVSGSDVFNDWDTLKLIDF